LAPVSEQGGDTTTVSMDIHSCVLSLQERDNSNKKRERESTAMKRGEEITHIKRERDNSMERERDNYFSELNKTYRYN
jgi:hypothetical protein